MYWYKRTDPNPRSYPPIAGRILVFSPEYPEGDPMRVRMIDAQFWVHTKDATHWTHIIEPQKMTEKVLKYQISLMEGAVFMMKNELEKLATTPQK